MKCMTKKMRKKTKMTKKEKKKTRSPERGWNND